MGLAERAGMQRLDGGIAPGSRARFLWIRDPILITRLGDASTLEPNLLGECRLDAVPSRLPRGGGIDGGRFRDLPAVFLLEPGVDIRLSKLTHESARESCATIRKAKDLPLLLQ